MTINQVTIYYTFFFFYFVLSPEMKLWEIFEFSYCLLMAYKFIIVGVIKYKNYSCCRYLCHPSYIFQQDPAMAAGFVRWCLELNPAVSRIMLTC